MAETHAISLEVGTSHGLWQYKLSGTHERVIVHSLRHILDATCMRLGYDRADRETMYLFGDFKVKGFMPAAVNAGYLRGWPERIYFRLDTSTAGGIVS